VAEVRAGAADTLGYIGEVRAARRAELAFPVAGRVATVAVEVGERVRAGQVLATLDLQPLQAQLAAAQADLARAEAQVAEARLRAERVQRAQVAGAASGGEVTGAKAELAAAEATVRAAAAQRDAAAWSLQQASLRAPLPGVVALRGVEPGQAAGPGAPVLAIDGDSRELSLLLPAALALQPGQALLLRSGTAAEPSRVLRVAGRLEAGGLRRVFVAVPDSAAVGSTWAVSLQGSQGGAAGAAAVRVPLRAVLPDASAGSGRVLRLAKDGRTVEQVAVTLGALHGDAIDITSGLAAGDRVVVAGAAGIRPGSVVKPVPYRGEVKS
jgi:RND family efflux transporter MFP subunit